MIKIPEHMTFFSISLVFRLGTKIGFTRMLYVRRGRYGEKVRKAFSTLGRESVIQQWWLLQGNKRNQSLFMVLIVEYTIRLYVVIPIA